MIRCECPICHAEYEENPHVCKCGFEGIEYPVYESERLMEEYEKKKLFKIYKFAKKVAMGEIPYQPSELVTYEYGDCICVDEALEERGLAYVEARGDGKRKTVAAEGLIVFRNRIKALYLNTDEAKPYFLEECAVKILLFGPDFRGFQYGYFMPFSPIRYIWVDADNPFLHAENNVLFDKDQTTLIFYAPLRPEEEYTVPKSVRTLKNLSFFAPDHLKKLFLPKGIKIETGALRFTGEVEIVYY